MNTKRVTVSLPDYLYEDMLALLGWGNVSSFVANAIEDKILEKKITKKLNPVQEFFDLRKITPKFNDDKIFEAIAKGRT